MKLFLMIREIDHKSFGKIQYNSDVIVNFKVNVRNFMYMFL